MLSTCRLKLVLTVLLPVVVAGSGAVWLAGCGGSGDGVGTLSVLVTDAPISRSLVKEAKIWVDKIEINKMSGVDSGFVTLYDGPAVELDLLNLTNGVTASLITAPLTPGYYRQLRLHFADAAITLTNDAKYATNDPAAKDLQLTSQATSGLKVFIDPPVQVESSLTTTLLLDFDLSKTFRPIPASGDPLQANRFQLGPVVRAVLMSTAGEIAGTCTVPTGDDPAAVTVYVLPAGDPDVANSVASTGCAADGSYRVIGLPTGNYDVRAESATASAVQAGVLVAPNNVVTVDLTLQPPTAP